MIRWVCPRCGSGKNAPTRPRKNDVRRYCLACSEETGVLVERSAPRLERKRAAKTELRRTKSARMRDAARERAIVRLTAADGSEHVVDVEAETHRALREMGFRRHVEIAVSRRHLSKGRGRAYPTETPPRIHYSLVDGYSYEKTMELIYHESAHVASGMRIGSHDRRWHGPRFRRVLADALHARWPFLNYGSVVDGGAYAADERIVEQMKQHILAGGTVD